MRNEAGGLIWEFLSSKSFLRNLKKTEKMLKRMIMLNQEIFPVEQMKINIMTKQMHI